MSKKLATWLALAGASVVPLVARASEFDVDTVGNNIQGLPPVFKDIGTAIPKIYDVAIAIAVVVFVILFLIGGIRYLTNAGNEEATGKAKKLMVDGIIGLVLTLAAWALANFVYVQLTGHQIGGTADSSGGTNPNGPLDNATTPPLIASTDPTQGHFCAAGSTNCSSVTLTFRDQGGSPAANYRFQLEVTPPQTALRWLGIAVAQATGPTQIQSSQVITSNASGQATVTAITGATLKIKEVSGTVLSTATITAAVQALAVQVTQIVTRQVNFKFLQSNSLEPISSYQFLVKDRTNRIVAGPLTSSVAGYQQADLPKGEVINITTTDGVVVYSDTVPDDNGRIWTIFLNSGGRVGFRVQFVAANGEPIGGLGGNVRLGNGTATAYIADSQGYIGPVTADVGVSVSTSLDAETLWLSNGCTFTVPPRNAAVFPCLVVLNPNLPNGTDTPTGPPATPR